MNVEELLAIVVISIAIVVYKYIETRCKHTYEEDRLSSVYGDHSDTPVRVYAIMKCTKCGHIKKVKVS